MIATSVLLQSFLTLTCQLSEAHLKLHHLWLERVVVTAYAT